MRINWSNRAIAESGQFAEFIEKDSSEATARVASRIFDRAVSLASMPERGTPGRVAGTREKAVHPWPCFIVYRIVGQDVRTLRIRRGARQWLAKSIVR